MAGTPPVPPQGPSPQQPLASISSEITNTSGQGETAIVPPELSGWNWAALLWTWIWAISHRVWIGLICIIPIPIVSLVMQVILGINGNKWAWQNKKWQSVDDFKKSQRKWVKAYFILLLLLLAFSLGITFLLVAINPGGKLNESKDAKTINDITTIKAVVNQSYISQTAYPWEQSGSGGETYFTADLAKESWLNGLIATGDLSSSTAAGFLEDPPLALVSRFGQPDFVICFQPQSKTYQLRASDSCQNFVSATRPYLDPCQAGKSYYCY
ncbi:MAG: hypothetical protein WC686_00110 [Candidatus Shapirobacteria bacterium]